MAYEAKFVDGAAKVLNENTRARIEEWKAKFPDDQQGRRSAVIQSLVAAQDQQGGWLTEELMDGVADYLDLPPVWIYEVASFYSLFHTEPTGRHKVQICDNISCMLCGANEIVEHVQNKLGIKLGETTQDGRITLVVEEECLAACVGAPMMIVDGHYHEHLTTDKVDQILDGLE